jgi:peptidoglycan/LPS O-acetylase OafA/YrhL
MKSRHLGIDLLKVVCAQLIVLHHAVTYAPASLGIARHWPGLHAFLTEPGRWVVHVFLVVGGYLTALGLDRLTKPSFVSLAIKRYLRLMPLFVLALLATVAVGWAVRHRYAPEFVSPMPTLGVWLAHLTLSFDWFGLGAISAGAWYVAIDFQLYLLALVWTIAGRRLAYTSWAWLRPAGMALAVVLSAWFINRHPEWDVWAPYFLSAYGLGCLVAWAQRDVVSRCWLWAVLVLLVLDLVFDWRGRQALALMSAVVLLVWPWLALKSQPPAWLARACDLSYALFVSHFALLIGLGAWLAGPRWAHPAYTLLYLLAVVMLSWLWAMLIDGVHSRLGSLARYFSTRPRWA